MPKRESADAPSYDIGELLRVTSGPFANFTGSVEKVDRMRGKVFIAASVFGRPTVLELAFRDVEKVRSG